MAYRKREGKQFNSPLKSARETLRKHNILAEVLSDAIDAPIALMRKYIYDSASPYDEVYDNLNHKQGNLLFGIEQAFTKEWYECYSADDDLYQLLRQLKNQNQIPVNLLAELSQIDEEKILCYINEEYENNDALTDAEKFRLCNVAHRICFALNRDYIRGTHIYVNSSELNR